MTKQQQRYSGNPWKFFLNRGVILDLCFRKFTLSSVSGGGSYPKLLKLIVWKSFPHFPNFSCIDLFSVLQTHQALSYLKAFAHALPSAWNTFPSFHGIYSFGRSILNVIPFVKSLRYLLYLY